MTQLTPEALQNAFKTEESLEQKAVLIAKDISAQSYDISHLVEELGFALTATTIDERLNGTRLLSNTLARLPPNLLTEAQLEYLVTFYADRLKDQHSIIPTVIDGIDALIAMQHLPRKSGVPKLLRSFFQHTTCQSQMRSDRAKFFKILQYMTQHYENELKSMSADFIYGLISSIDGERDPRNLDSIFTFMPDVLCRFPLLHLSEEMFEVFACYFPIDFNPSKSDPAFITRDALADKLANCLVATPDFVEWTVALALEKLESDLVVAKLDSLELLHRAALKFPAPLLQSHFDKIWLALKVELFPGSDNMDLVNAGLRTLRTILEEATAYEKDASIGESYQTSILGTILPHLSDIKQRLFKPATAIALCCISSNANFATERVLGCFVIKLKEANQRHDNSSSSSSDVVVGDEAQQFDDEDRIKVYTIIAQAFKIAAMRNAVAASPSLSDDSVYGAIHDDLINCLLRCCNKECAAPLHSVDVMSAALSALNECVTTLSERSRALIYRTLIALITSDTLDSVELMKVLLKNLGAHHSIELQTHCIDILIRNFRAYNNFVKQKIYSNLLPLISQAAFTERILELILMHIFSDDASSAGDDEEAMLQEETEKEEEEEEDDRLLAFTALNQLLIEQNQHFIEELQHNNCLIDKLITMMRCVSITKTTTTTKKLTSITMERASDALCSIMRQLSPAEQYIIVTEYVPQLQLQHECDLYIARGLLSYLHSELSLDDYFEDLLNSFKEISLNSDCQQLRSMAHHLLCSLVNKIDDVRNNATNRNSIRNLISKLKESLNSAKAEKAVELLSWLAKGLMVRDGTEAGEIIETLAELLEHPTLSTAAQLAFEILATEFPQLHLPIVKMLFKQKYFHLLLSKLGHKLETFSQQHLNAFIYVMKATPHAVLKLNLERIGPILFRCLESQRTQTLCIALQICENFMRQPEEEEYFRSHLNHIIPCCLQLSQYKASMQVRIAALQLLYDITKYPAYVLLPHKMDVVLGLAPALDDRKRLVRNASVVARNTWFLIGALTVEE